MIPRALCLGCYFLSDIHLLQSTYPCNPRCCKQRHWFSYFSLVSFVGNSLCRVKRTLWPLLFYFLNQPFVMTTIEVTATTLVIKCIIWCQCSYDSCGHIKSKTEGLSWINFFTRLMKVSKDLGALEKKEFSICRHLCINNTLPDLT